MITGTIFVIVLFRGCVMSPYLIPSSGMENSLYEGERILVNKWSYGLRLPFMAWLGYHRWQEKPVQKEDIIVFNNPANLSERILSNREVFIGRCIGMPGDTLLMDSLFSAIPDDSIEARPFIIPGKGKAVRVYPWNKVLLCNTLILHEKKQAEVKNDTLYIEGKPALHCYFTKDYHWVEANNSINLCDSRMFGLVPKDHIIGKASLIWFSKEAGTGLFEGYRRNRMWTKVR